MAVVLGGFSIREYASKMRSLDMAKCWPFGEVGEQLSGDGVGGFMEAFLPPITVRKFRWWSDEIQSSSSQKFRPSDTDMPSPPPPPTTTSTTSIPPPPPTPAPRVVVEDDGYDDEDDDDDHESPLKSRFRTPKKRSIIDIFAVAPQVQRLDVHDDYAYGTSSSDGEEIADRDRDSREVSSLLNNNNKFNNGRKNNKLMDNKGKKKCKTSQPQDEATLSSLCKLKKKTQKNKLQSSGTFLKKPRASMHTKRLTKHSFAAACQKKKQRLRQMENRIKTNTVGISKRTAEDRKAVSSVLGILKKQKKVVSGQNSTVCSLHGNAKSNRHVRFSGKDDILGLRRKCFPSVDFPKSQIHTEEIRLKLTNVDANQNDKDVSVTTVNGTEKPRINTHWLSNTASLNEAKVLRLPYNDSKGPLPDHSATVNYVPPSNEKLHLFENHAPRFLPVRNGAHMNLQVGASSSISTHTERMLINQSWCTSPRGSSDYSMERLRTFPQHSSPCFSGFSENVYGKFPFPSQTPTKFCNSQASLQPHPFSHPSPIELTSQAMHPFPYLKQRGIMCDDKYRNKYFVGLPLNSQGELMRSKVGPSRSISLPYGTEDHLYSKSSNENAQSDFFSPMDLMNIPDPKQKQYAQVHNHQENGEIYQKGNPDPLSMCFSEPTMRLMGKEFIIGRQNIESERGEDGDVWLGMQRRQFQQEYVIPPALRRKRNTTACSSPFQIMNLSQSVPHMQFPHSGFSHTCQSCQPNAAYGNNIHQQFVGGFNSPYHTSHDTSFNPVRFKNKQKLSESVEESAFKVPFLHEEHVRPSWLLNATPPLKEAIGSWQSYTDTDSRYYPCTMLGNDHQTIYPIIAQRPEFSFQYSTPLFTSARPNIFEGPAYSTGLPPNSIIDNGKERRKKSKTRSKSRIN